MVLIADGDAKAIGADNKAINIVKADGDADGVRAVVLGAAPPPPAAAPPVLTRRPCTPRCLPTCRPPRTPACPRAPPTVHVCLRTAWHACPPPHPAHPSPHARALQHSETKLTVEGEATAVGLGNEAKTKVDAKGDADFVRSCCLLAAALGAGVTEGEWPAGDSSWRRALGPSPHAPAHPSHHARVLQYSKAVVVGEGESKAIGIGNKAVTVIKPEADANLVRAVVAGRRTAGIGVGR